jgi:CRP-like cAMP-binding protein
MVMVDGEVEARRASPDVVWRGGRGDIVCGTAAFVDGVWAWQARAVTDARVLTFRVEDWLDLMEEQFEMVRATLGALHRRNDHLLEDLARSDPERNSLSSGKMNR